ncbi:amino acid/polyamine/organocation transporter, APC superfamily [Austwickia chelonae]|uniref:Putative amino acid transporter n=1 Tax=Austwickia chelonae NBRC 105200 TaxID=1184607 RepID=K6VQM3_9MICO|nr:putative amino acid transporter [Austwickia chelonae NBRC 105200]SEW41623.1 amino acid/polyamine/organocation transporter, APC superfamily [Austwickia chelonae]
MVGAIIGWGSFTLPGSRFLQSSGVVDTAIGLGIGAVLMVFIQTGYHVMMVHHGDEGGEFSYAYKHLGPGVGFAVGWSLLLAYISLVGLNGTAFVLVLKRVFGEAVSIGYLYSVAGYPVYASDVVIASAIMIVFAWLNIRGLRGSARAQNVLVLGLVANVVVVFVLMFFLVDLDPFTRSYLDGWSVSWGRVGSVVAIVPFLFVGFDVIPQVSRDLGFAPGMASRFAVLGIALGSLLYAALNTLTGMVFSPEQVSAVTWPTGAAVQAVLGPVGLGALILALAGAVMGGINAFMLSSGKLAASLANHRFLPAQFLRRNQAGVHDRAVLLALGIGLIAPWAGREVVNYIVNMCSVLAGVAYLSTCLISTRVGDGAERWRAVVGVLASLVFLMLLLLPGSPGRLGSTEFVALAVWVAAGVVVYLARRRQAWLGPIDEG